MTDPYDNHAAAGSAGEQARARLAAQAAHNRISLPGIWDMRYGPRPEQVMDFYPIRTSDAPVACLVLVPGGGWLAGSPATTGFWAQSMNRLGVAHVVLGHTKRPDATLAEMRDEIVAGWQFVHKNAANMGISSDRISLAGISSGATLAALCAIAVHGYAPPASLLLMTGMYDLEPVRCSARNAKLNLSEADARALSPLHAADRLPSRLAITCGEADSPAFRWQARSLAARCGARARLLDIPHANHFSQAEAMLDTGTALYRLMSHWLTHPLAYAVPDTMP